MVIDPSINAAKMEMYADRQARGGILEPAGTVEVKMPGHAMPTPHPNIYPLTLIPLTFLSILSPSYLSYPSL